MKKSTTQVTDTSGKPMRGKWAEGIVPRHFRWILTDKLAICERPGGYGDNHRKVRRQEEIIWMRQNRFDWVVSIIPSNHNLHNYEELSMPFLHRPIAEKVDLALRLPQLYEELSGLLEGGRKLIVHSDAVDDTLLGYVGGYLLWSDLTKDVPQTITVIEHMLERKLGPRARTMVTAIDEVKNG